jgi:hypothetical protein
VISRSILSLSAIERAYETADGIPEEKRNLLTNRNLAQSNGVSAQEDRKLRIVDMVTQCLSDRRTAALADVQEMDDRSALCSQDDMAHAASRSDRGAADLASRAHDQIGSISGPSHLA